MRMLGTDLRFSFRFLSKVSHILFSYFTDCMKYEYEFYYCIIFLKSLQGAHPAMTLTQKYQPD